MSVIRMSLVRLTLSSAVQDLKVLYGFARSLFVQAGVNETKSGLHLYYIY